MKFRFIISEDLKEEMENFSKIHISSTRHEIKDCWEDWIEDNKNLIIEEKEKLEKSGYSGTFDDFIEKLFFSVKYYYIKRAAASVSKEVKPEPEPEPKKEGSKIRFSKTILQIIDNHICDVLIEGEKPCYCYLQFINNNKDKIYAEILNIRRQTDGKSIKTDQIFEKLQKCYKNRYYDARRAFI